MARKSARDILEERKKREAQKTTSNTSKATQVKSETKTKVTKPDVTTLPKVKSTAIKPNDTETEATAKVSKAVPSLNKDNYNKAKILNRVKDEFQNISDSFGRSKAEGLVGRENTLSMKDYVKEQKMLSDASQKYGLTDSETKRLYRNVQKQADVERKVEEAKKNRIKGTLGAVGDEATAKVLGIPNAIADVINNAKGEKVTANDESHYHKNAADKVRSAISDTIKTDSGKTAYNVTNSVLDLAAQLGLAGLANPIGQAGGNLVANLGSLLNAGGEVERNMIKNLENGADVNKAAGAALTRGATQFILDKAGLKGKDITSKADLAKQVLKTAGVEGGLNALQEGLGIATDRAILGRDSDYSTIYHNVLDEMRYTGTPMEEIKKIADETARNYVKGNVVQGFGTGALFGGAMEGMRGIPALRNIQDIDPTVKKAIEQTETAKKNIEELANQIPRTPDEIRADMAADIQQRIDRGEKISEDDYALLDNYENSIPQTRPELETTNVQRPMIEQKNNINNAETITEVDPMNVIYHAGTLSRLNKAETAGKMEGSRDTGYYGTGHYFVDNAHRNEIGRGTYYGNKPLSSVDISRYDNLFKADTDAKASKLHNLSQRMMRYINGHNDRYYTENGEINTDSLKEYMDDMYSDYKELFSDNAMDRDAFETRVNDFKNNYSYDSANRGDSAFTTFMKEHGYNGVDTRGTNSANTERGVVIYDLDEDSVLQSNVTDDAVKNGLMNSRVRNGNPVFDAETDSRLQKDIDAFNKKQQIQQEYTRIYDTTNLNNLDSEIKGIKERIDNLEENALPYYKSLLDEKTLERALRKNKNDFESLGLEYDIEQERINLVNDAKEEISNAENELSALRQTLAERQSAYDTEEKLSYEAMKQARANIENAQPDVNSPINDTVTNADINNINVEIPSLNRTQTGFDGGNNNFTGDEIPRMESKGDKVSQTYTNTGKYGGGWNEQEYKAYTDAQDYKYESDTERNSVNKAWEMIREKGADNVKADLLNKEFLDHTEIDALMSLWRVTVANARSQEANGVDASSLWKESNNIFKKIQTESTHNAQALQALAKWSRNTPEGLLAQAYNYIRGISDGQLKFFNSPLGKQLKNYADKNNVKLSDDFVKEFIAKAEELQNFDIDSREAKEIMATLAKMTTSQVPVKFREKLIAYMMDNMLGNFRTLISRNAGGNLGLNAIEQFLERPLAALIDKGLAKKTGIRTQADFTKEGLLQYLAGFRQGLSDEILDIKSGLHTARSGENTFQNALNMNRRIFKNPISNVYDQFVKHGLSVGDRPFYESTYKQTLSDYYDMKKKGYFPSSIKKLNDSQFKEVAETAAHLNALFSVYQNDTLISKGLMSLKNGLSDISRGTLGFDALSQFSMPFVKTPANVMDRLVSYSPYGLVRTGINTGRKLNALKNVPDAEARETMIADIQNYAANETARGLIGSGIQGAGAFALGAGIMSGSFSEDQDEKQAQKNAGEQEYALKLNKLIPSLDKEMQMDISWIPGVGEDLVAGASAIDAYNKAKEEGDVNLADAIAAGLKASGNAMFNQSMWQGAQRLFGGASNYNDDKSIVANVADTVASGLTQFIPGQSLMRQAAQTLDSNKRDLTYTLDPLTVGGVEIPINRGYTVNNLINSVPYLRNTLLPDIDAQGNEKLENQGRSIGYKALENMILPGKVTEITTNPLDEEAREISEKTKNKYTYISEPSRNYLKNNGIEMTDKEWLEYEKKYGKSITEVGNAIIANPMYQYFKNKNDYLSAEKVLSDSYQAVRNVINNEYTDSKLTGASKAYKEGGVRGLVDYEVYSQMLADVGLTNNEKNRETLKKEGISFLENIKEENQVLSSGGVEVNQSNRDYINEYGESVVPTIKALEDAGVNAGKNAINAYNSGVTTDELLYMQDNDLNYERYANAKNIVPSLTPQTYYKTYKDITKDGKGDATIDDMLNYLNSHDNVNAEEIINLFATQEGKYILEGGKWVYKKKSK